jgi:L-ribulose-5-phosphate 4-epimerase
VVTVDPAMQDLARRLALACRIVALQGHGDLIFGHLSARLPDGNMLMKPNGLGLDEIQPEDILVLDLAGNLLGGPHGVHLEHPIHGEILRARPDVQAVVHTHPHYSVALGASQFDLQPLTAHGCYFVPPAVPKFSETTDLIVTKADGEAVARTLGDHRAVLLVNHGVAVTGPNVEEAAIAAILLEEACQIQLLTQSYGPGYHVSPPDQAIARRTRVFPGFIPSLWAYLVRQVVRRWPECQRFAQ